MIHYQLFCEAFKMATLLNALVPVDIDGKIVPQGVDYSKLIPILVKAIQEQNQTITQQGLEIEQLKQQLNK